MATATKIKLDVNVPLTGTVKYVDFYPEKENPNQPGKVMAAQWALTGSWSWRSPEYGDVSAEGKVYIDEYQLAASPVALGFVEANGTWDDGNPKFKWTYKAAVRLLKTEDGKKRHVTISRLDQTAPTVAAGSPPPAAVAPVAHQSGQAPVRVPSGTPAPVPPSQDEWSQLERQYERARIAACRVWGENYDPTALVAATATVFIEANKRGLKIVNPAAGYEQMPPAISREEPMPWDR